MVVPSVAQKARRVDQVIAEHRRIRRPTEVRHLGLSFRIHPNVFSPFIAPSGFLSLSLAAWPIFEGKRVLDVGCGAGIFACLAALSGASQVVGVDINPDAIKNAKYNAQMSGVSDTVELLEGNLFEPIDPKKEFDIIFADLPFTSGVPTDFLEMAFYDPDLQSLRTFVRTLPERLIHSGDGARAFLCISDLETLDLEGEAGTGTLDFKNAMLISLSWINLFLYEIKLSPSERLR